MNLTEMVRRLTHGELVAIEGRGPAADAVQAEKNLKALLTAARVSGACENADWAQSRADLLKVKALDAAEAMLEACREAEPAAAPTAANDDGDTMDERRIPDSAEELEQLRRALRAKLAGPLRLVETKSHAWRADGTAGVAGVDEPLGEQGAHRPA